MSPILVWRFFAPSICGDLFHGARCLDVVWFATVLPEDLLQAFDFGRGIRRFAFWELGFRVIEHFPVDVFAPCVWAVVAGYFAMPGQHGRVIGEIDHVELVWRGIDIAIDQDVFGDQGCVLCNLAG